MSLAGIFTAWSIRAATADSGSRPATFGAPVAASGAPVAAPGGSVLAARLLDPPSWRHACAVSATACAASLLSALIAAGRRLLQYCKFDQVKTLKGLDGLGKYRFPWDETNKTFGPEPIHDWASHPGSAFRIFALHPHESNDWIGSEQPKPSHNVTASDVLSLLTQRRDGYNVSAPVLT